MWANNVQCGVWHGQNPVLAAAPVYTVPHVADMQTDYKPVSAKDFV